MFRCLFFQRILALEKLGAVFNQVATPLQYTPRKFVIHPQSNNLVIIESDHNAFTDKVKEEKKQQIAEVCNSDNVATALTQMLYLMQHACIVVISYNITILNSFVY